MQQVILYIAQSIDGYIADIHGSVDWLHPYQQLESDFGYQAFWEKVGVLVMGATTYEQILDMGEWPYGDKPVLVCSHRQLTKVTENVVFVTGDMDVIVEEARALCPEDKHIWLVGGAQIVQQVMDLGLLDLIMLFTMPTLLGEGIKLFDGVKAHLHTVLAQEHVGGVIETHYARQQPDTTR